MNKFLSLFLVTTLLMGGCTFLPQPPDLIKITNSKVDNPFFNIPPDNLIDYEKGAWILLAQSKTKNWFYDPYSLKEDAEGIISFNTFYVPREGVSRLNQFNATMVGPYLQKIDCFGNYQWSEIFYADKMPSQTSYKNPLKPDQEWGWIKIKSNTAMTFIRSRVCGRKFLDEKDINFFLYQKGVMKFAKDKVDPTKVKITPEPPDPWIAQFIVPEDEELIDQDVKNTADGKGKDFPIFFEVINNEVLMLDIKRDIRQMRIASFNMDQYFSKNADYIFKADCQNKTYSFLTNNKFEDVRFPKDSFESVAFDRICGDHGAYMRFIKPARK